MADPAQVRTLSSVNRAGLLGVVVCCACALQTPPVATVYAVDTAPRAVTRQPPTSVAGVDRLEGEFVDLEEHPSIARSTSREVLYGAVEGDRLGGVNDEQYFREIVGMQGVSTLFACPLVFVPPRTSVTLHNAAEGAFDWNGPQPCKNTDWPSPRTPWLVMDRDQDGEIDSGAELFGTGTILRGGRRAVDGFDALAELDEDQDGSITPRDAAWARLQLWSDADGDRRSTPDELSTLEEAGMTALSLDASPEVSCDAAGNCTAGRSPASVAGGANGELVDVYLRCR